MLPIIAAAVEKTITSGEDVYLINALIQAVSEQTGALVFTESLNGLEFEPVEGTPELPKFYHAGSTASWETFRANIIETIEHTLVDLGYDGAIVSLATGAADCAGNAPHAYTQDVVKPTHYGIRLTVQTPLSVLIGFHLDLVVLEGRYVPVATDLLPKPTGCTEDEPAVLLRKHELATLVYPAPVDEDALESVSVAALALGWADTESYGKMLMLLA